MRSAMLVMIALASAAVALGAQSPTPVDARPVVRVELRTLNGDAIRIGPREQPTIVAVFATWCRSCADEVATLNTLARDVATVGVRVVAVNVDKQEAASVQRWLTAHRASYGAALDTAGVAAHALGVVGVPEFYFVNGDGRVAFVRRGPVESVLTALRDAVKQSKQ